MGQGVLVIAEQREGEFRKITYEVVSEGRRVADALGTDVIAVVLAHIEAERVFRNQRDALVSQIPMVVLMVAYTTLSLWILAQPIVG